MAILKGAPHAKPPQDFFNPTIKVSTGCTHGKCLFCSIYDENFSVMTDEEVMREIEEVAKTATLLTRRVFLTQGNPYALPTERLLEIFDMVEERIPTVNSYGGFCRITDIKRKSDEELRLLASRGVSDITLGAESGSDETLDFIGKGFKSSDIVEQAERLHGAGIDFTFFYLAGLAGAGKGQENALASAEVFSKAAPKRILIHTITPTRTWRLAQNIQDGSWVPFGEKEVAKEILAFVSNITSHTILNCSHDTNTIKFEGILPADKEKMIQLLEHQIPKINEKVARTVREMYWHAKFDNPPAADSHVA